MPKGPALGFPLLALEALLTARVEVCYRLLYLVAVCVLGGGGGQAKLLDRNLLFVIKGDTCWRWRTNPTLFVCMHFCTHSKYIQFDNLVLLINCEDLPTGLPSFVTKVTVPLSTQRSMS